ncbi:MAG TPA: hypothetical protein VME67_19330 [Mycobacterium sp.]|nr:hypothetical protein [Mycobacterium sp.]HTX96811.1 hypothetical protein [Mycobacterium sp.]
MEVGERAPLEFNYFHERHARVLWILGLVSQLTAQDTLKLNREAPPQFWRMPGEKHVSDTVVAVTTKGLPERRLVVVMSGFAPARTAVLAFPPVGASRVTVAGCTSRVDGTEAGCREGHEQLGMLSNRGGYFVMSATKAGVDELPSVTGV